MSQPAGDHFQISVGGAVGGNVVVGRGNQIVSSPTNAPRPTADELATFRSAVDQLKATIETQAPPGAAAAATAHLDELHAAATAPTPDVSTMVRVRAWFVDHLPTFAGAVTGLLVHPVVGALVKSAGDAISEEFHRRVGAKSTELPRDGSL